MLLLLLAAPPLVRSLSLAPVLLSPRPMRDIEDIAATFKQATADPRTLSYSFSDVEVACVRRQLLDFYDRDRRMLPWRGDTVDGAKPPPQSAYGTWVSEIMLQQTRVETVIPYWHLWMQRFPTVASLAAASPDAVNAVWAGLGYYRRAQNLLKGAQKVVADHGGDVPRQQQQLLDIPGIGPYTAGAIGSIAFNQPVPLVDGNVIRVFSRLRAIKLEQGNSAMDKTCWALAQAAVDPARPGDFNQALMELGATVCVPKNPRCGACPVGDVCHARAIVEHNKLEGLPADPPDVTYFPRKLGKKKPREIALSVAVLHSAAPEATGHTRYLFVKRKAEGLLAGQWQFPSVAVWEGECGDAPPGAFSRGELWAPMNAYLQKEGVVVSLDGTTVDVADAAIAGAQVVELSSTSRSFDPIVHVFSHQKHTMHVRVYSATAATLTSASCCWMTAEEIIAAGITSGCKKVLEAVLARDAGPRRVQAKLSFGKASSSSSSSGSSSKRAKIEGEKEVIVIDD